MAARKLLNWNQLRCLLGKTWQEWNKDGAPRLGAALSYYTIFSLAPLLILIIGIAGLVFGEEAARGQLFGQIRGLVGEQGAVAIEAMVKNASQTSGGIIATLIGFGTLIFGASTVASELKASFNQVWNVPPDNSGGVKDVIKQRSTALGVILGCGFLLLVSLAVSSFLSGLGDWVASFLPVPPIMLQILNFVLGFAVITGVFAVLFRYMPDVNVEWEDVLLGAAFTALLFSIGKTAIGMYLGRASVGSTFGAAGSLVIVLVWVYYSAQILFFGAEFTQVYACDHGSDPLKKRARAVPDVQTSPKPILLTGSAPSVAATTVGQAAAGLDDRPSGMMGTLIGSALAATKVFRALRRN